MPRNIEIKARITNLAATESLARAIADQGPFDLDQDDTFFACPNGRLKLREFSAEKGELIFYTRPDVAGPKLSEYVIVPTSSPKAMRDLLERALSIVGRVRKRRRVYLVWNTRIHLDQVEGLGCFLELEVVLSDSQTEGDGQATAKGLLSKLNIPEKDLIEGAYLDLAG